MRTVFLTLMFFEQIYTIGPRLIISAAPEGQKMLFIRGKFKRIIGQKKSGIDVEGVCDLLDLFTLQVNTILLIFSDSRALDTDQPAELFGRHFQFFPACFDLFTDSHGDASFLHLNCNKENLLLQEKSS